MQKFTPCLTSPEHLLHPYHRRTGKRFDLLAGFSTGEPRILYAMLPDALAPPLVGRETTQLRSDGATGTKRGVRARQPR